MLRTTASPQGPGWPKRLIGQRRLAPAWVEPLVGPYLARVIRLAGGIKLHEPFRPDLKCAACGQPATHVVCVWDDYGRMGGPTRALSFAETHERIPYACAEHAKLPLPAWAETGIQNAGFAFIRISEIVRVYRELHPERRKRD